MSNKETLKSIPPLKAKNEKIILSVVKIWGGEIM
jgi:hypothetical protein